MTSEHEEPALSEKDQEIIAVGVAAAGGVNAPRFSRRRLALWGWLMASAWPSVFLVSCSTADAAVSAPPAPTVVSTIAVARQSSSRRLTIVGTIRAHQEVVVTSETQGKVTHVYVETGTFLRKNSIIAEVDRELKEVTLLAATARRDKAAKDLARAQRLHQERVISVKDLEAAELAERLATAEYRTARRHLDDSAIRAPLSGYLVERPVEVGATLQPGMPIGRIMELGRLKLTLPVGERDLAGLKTGDAVAVTVDAYPGHTYPGTIRTIGLVADNARAFPVEVVLANDQAHPLRAGQTANAEIRLAGSTALVVPRVAITGNATVPEVFVVDHDTAHRRVVELGAEIDTCVEVTRGLSEGERVVLDGAATVRDGVPVRLVATR